MSSNQRRSRTIKSANYRKEQLSNRPIHSIHPSKKNEDWQVVNGVPVPSKHRNVAAGGGVGGTIGAVIGAMVGGPPGAVIGAGIGASIGAGIGAAADEK